jgi:hypothetical protein
MYAGCGIQMGPVISNRDGRSRRDGILRLAGAIVLLVCPALAGCHPGRSDDSRRLQATTALAPPTSVVLPQGSPGLSDSAFAQLVEALSEPNGFFDSDNVISNETSYLHVLGGLRRVGVSGGGYIGVGPDQNYSYIAVIRPSIAFMLDIRRDNMFEHLLFKALFAMSRNRLEYLCLLTGKPVPRNIEAWTNRSLAEMIAHLDSTAVDAPLVAATRAAVDQRIASLGLHLSQQDREVADRYRAAFVADGLDVRFSSLNRNNRSAYPTLRRLILETDRAGAQGSYLASDEAFQFVKRMHARNLIIPVVGNVAGAKAMREIANYLVLHGERVSAFYTSNVEQYLMRDGTFDAFARNMKLLPHSSTSMLIRSYFGRSAFGHPLSLPGHSSTSMLEPIDTFLRDFDAGNLVDYGALVDRGYVAP